MDAALHNRRIALATQRAQNDAKRATLRRFSEWPTVAAPLFDRDLDSRCIYLYSYGTVKDVVFGMSDVSNHPADTHAHKATM